MKNLWRLLTLTLALCLMLSSMSAAFAASDTSGALIDVPAEDRVAKVVFSSAFAGSWDPTTHAILSNGQLEFNVYDPLFWYDWNAGELIPALGLSWEYIDDCTIQVKLREGVKFHDGSDFTAEDVKFTWELFTSEESVSSDQFNEQILVDIVDDYTVNLYPASKTPDASLTNLLSFIVILSSEDTAEDRAERMNGTGAYVNTGLVNDTVHLIANKDYWGGVPAIKAIDAIVMTDATARMNAVVAGEVDFIERVEAEQVPVLEGAGLTVKDVLVNENKWIFIKMKNELAQNKDFRKALAYAVDKETIVDVIMNGNGVVADNILTCVDWGYSGPLENLPSYDPELAKEYLAKAGYPNGEGLPTIKFVTSTGYYPKTKEYGEFLVQCWQEVGINVELIVLEQNAWLDTIWDDTDEYMLLDCGCLVRNPEPEIGLRFHFYNGGNACHGNNEEVNASLDKELKITDLAERKKVLHEETLALIADDCQAIPLFTSNQIAAWTPDLANVELRPDSNMFMKNWTWN